VEYGIVFPHHEIGTDPAAIKAFAQGAEDLGATHMLIYDHVLGADPGVHAPWTGPYDMGVAFHEPFTLFAFIAAVTQKIVFSTAVLILPQRQTALVAKQAAELAMLSEGRFRLGIGTGWNRVEYEALNEEFTNRGKRQEEQVDLMRKLWTEKTVTYTGKWHTVTAAGLNPRPPRTIPIWFGGGAPALLERCARIGDGWVPVMGPNDTAKASIETLRTHREAAGLSWDGFGIQAQAQIRGGSPERWHSHAERWKALGGTHLAVVTQGVGHADVDAHLAAVERYFSSVEP
jgi:probable F420-dependent oxidoreductase